MDHQRIQHERLPHASISTTLGYGALFIYGLYFLLQYLNLSTLPPHELLWNAVVYLVPVPLLLDAARRQELATNGMLSQAHAAKSDALRRMIGLGGNTILHNLPSGESAGGIVRRMSAAIVGGPSAPISSDAPPGLGNWDNSCYQNSVLQALSSLGSLRSWLRASEPANADSDSTTNTSLQETIARLRNVSNNGKHIWTPAKLKNMSSWQQQDAQEYFSKIMDELDKEAAKSVASKVIKPGLETIAESKRQDGDQNTSSESPSSCRNPLEGLVAQRVSCTRCGFSEGYSMIPFNCLTVPLGSSHTYDLENCLDEYTKSEDIGGVECRSCTLLHHAAKLKQLELPPELRGQIAQRLQAIEQALDTDDFSDKTVKQQCGIPAKQYVNSTKSKEVIIGRAPRSLVVHVNRSVFDPMTGMQRKNYAAVRYPFILDLQPWMLSAGDAPPYYELSAVVTHYGQHENGHYICYRKHPSSNAAEDADNSGDVRKESWWRLSDEDVSPMTQEDVLEQGDVFMLFYERVAEPVVPSSGSPIPATETVEEAAAIPLPPDDIADWNMVSRQPSSTATPSLVTSSAQSVVSESDTDTGYESGVDAALGRDEKANQQAPLMKTASPIFMRPAEKDMKYGIGMSTSMMSV